MDVSPARLLEHARSDDGRKQLRYLGVSLFFVPVGQVMIQIVGRMMGNYTRASIVCAAILTLPNFFANKYFVWRDTAKDNLRTQVLVFWVAAMLGVALATALTYFTEKAMVDQTPFVKGVAVFIAQIVGFGIVWVARYLLLDKWLFKVTHDGAEPTDEEIDELHKEFPI